MCGTLRAGLVLRAVPGHRPPHPFELLAAGRSRALPAGVSSSTGAGSSTASFAARIESSRAFCSARRAAGGREVDSRRTGVALGVRSTAGLGPPVSAAGYGRPRAAAAATWGAAVVSRAATDAVRPGPMSELAVQPSPTAATRLAAQAPQSHLAPPGARPEPRPAPARRRRRAAAAAGGERGEERRRAIPQRGDAVAGRAARRSTRRDGSRSRRTETGSAPGPDRRAARLQECAASVPVSWFCCRSCASTRRRRARASVVPTAPTASPVCAAISG